MNTSLWQLAAWTMIHSLWIGAAVALLGATLRLACRRAAANARYAVSLATLVALAITPIAAAAWLSVNGVPQLAAAPVPVMDSVLLPPPGGEGWGGGPAGHMTLDAFSSHPPQPAPQIIDLAHLNPSHRYSGERLGKGPTPLTTTPTNNPSTIATVENPFPTPSLPGRGTTPPLPLPPSALPLAISRLISLLPTLWLIGAPLTFLLLAAGLIGSERLRRRATPIVSGPAYDACQRLRHTLKITRRVALAACDEIAQPILVGIVRPLILLPTAALAGWTPEQLDMVLLHELAHVRRWDNLVNLAQRIVESVLFYHPAVWLLSRQVRRDREECCDATVVARILEPTHYAELLITIAATSRRSRLSGAPSLTLTNAMASHPLAGRIRRILNLQEEPMRITRRTLAATLLLPLLLAAAILYSGANAEDPNTPPPSKGWEQPSTLASGERAQGGSAREATRGGTETAEQSDAPASDKQTEISGDQSASLAEANLRGSTDAQLKSQEEYVALRSSQEQSLRQEANRPIEDVIAAEFLTDRAISTFQRMLESPADKEDDGRSVREMLSNLRSMKDKLEIQRKDYRKAVEEGIRKRLDSRTSTAIYADLVANRGTNGPRPPQTEHPTSSTTDIHFTVAAQLHHEIRNLESLVAKAQEELVNLETFKELAVRGSQKSGALEEAVEAELSKDPTIKLYNEQLVAMQSALKSREYEASDSNGKRLRALILQTEAQFAEYRQIAEKAARDRIAKQPNETLRAAVIEYKIRRKAAEDNLAKHKRDLEAAKAKLAQLTATSAAPATPPAPLLDGLEQLRLAFEQQRPLFASRTDAPLSKVTYDAANLPAIVDEHWNYLAEGIRNRDGLPPIGWSWTRDAGQQYVIEAPQHAHEQFLKPLFDGTLPTVQPVSPGSPNQSAATAESHPEEKPQSEWNVTATKEFIVHFPPNFPDSQQERKRILNDFEGGYLRAMALTNPPGNQFSYTLHVRVPVDWNPKAVWESHANGNAVRMVCRIVNEPAAAHPPLTTLRPEAPIQGAATASPGSPNQDDEATRSPSDKTAPPAQASRGSAAPVQEPVLPAPSQTAPPTATSHDENAPAPLSQALADLEQRKQAVLEAQAALRSAEKGTTYAKDELIEKYVALNWEETPELHVLQRQEAAIRAQLKKQTASGAATDDATVRQLQASLAHVHEQLDERLESMKADVSKQVATGNQRFLDNLQEVVRSQELKLAEKAAHRAQQEFQAAIIRLTQLEANDLSAMPAVAIEVVQPPTSVATGIFGGSSRTTAYLKVAINRSTNPFASTAQRATPQEIERLAMNSLALVKSPAVLKAALNVVTPRDSLDMWQDEAVEHLQKRFTAAFPGDGEILELQLEGANAKEDAALLQAIIDAFIAAMKTPPQSPADPNAASDSAGAPGDLSRYMAGTADRAPKASSSGAADYKHPVGFAEALDQCRKSGKPVVVHLLAHHSAPSNRFADEVLADPQVADFIAKHFVSVTIYADDEPAFAKAYHADFVPANIFVFAGGVRTTGSIPVPAIPAEYLAYLKNYYELAITPELQKLAGHIVPELWPAPVADRPGAGGPGSPNQGGAATRNPSDKPSPTAAASPDPAAPVQESEAPAYAPPTATFLYDGKTFEQWRDLWKLELNPERRAEAINALAAFGRSGRGQEAADAILEVAGEYPDSYSPTSAEGKLLKAIDAAVARMPAEQWMPQVLERIDSSKGTTKELWQRRAIQFLRSTKDVRPEARTLAAKFAEADDAQLLGAVSYYLLRNDQKLSDPLTVELVRKALRRESPNYGDILVLLNCRRLDEIPEQIDLLVRRPGARAFLEPMIYGHGTPSRSTELFAPLLEVLQDPKRGDDRIGALRVLRGLHQALNYPRNKEARQHVADQLNAILINGPDELLPAAIMTSAKVFGVDPGDVPTSLLQLEKITPERAKHLQELDELKLFEERNAE